MFVEHELREDLTIYCMITKRTQEQAANVALKELLQRLQSDPEVGPLMAQLKMIRAAGRKREATV